jgi:hypothetical protein
MAERNPRYNGLYVYKLDLKALQSGDVILTRNAESTSFKGKAVSHTIALVSRGNFSHALICTTPPTLIEAIDEGVSNINAQNCFVHDLEHIRILRYPDASLARRASSAAMLFFAKGYSVRAAMTSVIPGVTHALQHDDRTFCSAFVTAAYRAAGAPEFLALDPMKTTPAKLQKAAFFKDVTQDVCQRILSPNNIEEMSALDGNRMPSPMAGQAPLLNSYYTELSVPIDGLMAAHPTLTEHRPNSFFECLQFISALCVAMARFPDNEETIPVKEQAKRIDALAYAFLTEGKWQAMQEAAQARDEESIQYTLSESFKRKPDIELDDTLGMIRASKEQIISRASILDDPDRPLGYSCAWDEWDRQTRESLPYFERRLAVLNEALARVFPSAAKG